MPGTAEIEKMSEAFGQLRRALSNDDIIELVAATRAVSVATEQVRSLGAVHVDREFRSKLLELSQLIDAARTRINLATDDVRRRLADIADQGGHRASALYSR